MADRNPTDEQRKAIQAYVRGDLMPLIESVLVKRLGLAAVFLRDQVLAEPCGGQTFDQWWLARCQQSWRATLAPYELDKPMPEEWALNFRAEALAAWTAARSTAETDVGINGLTEAETSASASVAGIIPYEKLPSVNDPLPPPQLADQTFGCREHYYDGKCPNCGGRTSGVPDKDGRAKG